MHNIDKIKRNKDDLDETQQNKRDITRQNGWLEKPDRQEEHKGVADSEITIRNRVIVIL